MIEVADDFVAHGVQVGVGLAGGGSRAHNARVAVAGNDDGAGAGAGGDALDLGEARLRAFLLLDLLFLACFHVLPSFFRRRLHLRVGSCTLPSAALIWRLSGWPWVEQKWPIGGCRAD